MVFRLLRFSVILISSVASFLLSLSLFLSIFSGNPPDSSLFLTLSDDDVDFSVVNVDDDDSEPFSNFSLFLESRHDEDEDVPVQKSQAAG